MDDLISCSVAFAVRLLWGRVESITTTLDHQRNQSKTHRAQLLDLPAEEKGVSDDKCRGWGQVASTCSEKVRTKGRRNNVEQVSIGVAWLRLSIPGCKPPKFVLSLSALEKTAYRTKSLLSQYFPTSPFSTECCLFFVSCGGHFLHSASR